MPEIGSQIPYVPISVLHGALYDMVQMHCGICEIGLLSLITAPSPLRHKGLNGWHFMHSIFLCCASLKEKLSILIKMSPKFLPKGLLDNKTALVQIMAWCCQSATLYLKQCLRSMMPYGFCRPQFVNSLRPSDANRRHQPRPSLVQIIACCLFGTKPLSEPMLEYCQFTH